MRRQLALVALATTSLVVVALLFPLALAVRTIPRDRAISNAQLVSQSLAQTITAVQDQAQLRRLVEQKSQLANQTVSVVLPDGSVLGAPVVASRALNRAKRGEALATYRSNGDLEILTPTATAAGTAIVRVVVPESTLRRGVLSAWAILGLLGLLLVVLAVSVSDRLARSIVKPITALASTTRALERGQLDARVEPSGPREVREVGSTLNLLADRIDDLVVTEREAIADLSHRLRTPITALRLDAEGLSNDVEAKRILSGVDDLTRAVDNLIRTARGPTSRTAVSCDVVKVAQARAQYWWALAEEQHRAFDIQIPHVSARVPVSADSLAAAFDVLLENVFAHTNEGTAFSLVVTLGRGIVRARVSDSGPGFDEASTTRGASRSGSTGLGLSIAQATVEECGGTFTIARKHPHGAIVTMDLPVSPTV